MINLNNSADSPTVRLSKLKSIQTLVDRGIRYELRMTDCGKQRCHKCNPEPGQKRVPTHGPYWYLIAVDKNSHKRRTIYLGDRLDTNKYRTPEGGFDHDAYAARPKRPTRTAETAPQLADLDESCETACPTP